MITVKLFAILKDKAGTGEIQLSGNIESVSNLLRQVSRELPALSDILTSCTIMVSVNQEFVKPNALVKDGDEVALMPPFSGGDEPSERIRIQQGPFSLELEVESLKRSSTSIGAIVTFVGTTRDISRGKEVARLELEHYPGMAEKKLAEIRSRAIAEYRVIDVTIVHRIGTMSVGEDIVLIVVVAGHRNEAFNACRFCIDELKRITPIWKKETTPDGEVWVEEHP